MMQNMEAVDIEMAAFTAELIEQKLQEISKLETDQATVARLGNVSLRQAAEAAHEEELGKLSTELGELATLIPTEAIEHERQALEETRQRPLREAEQAVAQLSAHAEELSALLPFVTTEISLQASASIAAIRHEAAEQQLSGTDTQRSNDLARVEAVLETPIRSAPVARHLFAYFESLPQPSPPIEETAAEPDTHLKPLLTAADLKQLLTATEPRARLQEFCEVCLSYPIEINQLGEGVYAHDERDSRKHRELMHVMVQPRQKAGVVTYRELRKRGLVLQVGWVQSMGNGPTSSRRRVVRSLRATDYRPELHAIEEQDATHYYSWDPIDASVLVKRGSA